MTYQNQTLINEDTQTFGVGPWQLDCAMARRLGYTENEIRNMCETLAANSRGYNALHSAHLKNQDTPKP